MRYAGVVYEDVTSPKTFSGEFEGSFEILQFVYVTFDAQAVCAKRLDLGAGTGELVFIARRDAHIGTGFSECQRESASNAAWDTKLKASPSTA